MSHYTENTALNLETSQDIALQALIFIAEDTKRLSNFLKTTGLNSKEIRENSVLPGFLVGVLDYLLGNESLLLCFCSNKELDPTTIAPAKDFLENSLRSK